MQFLSQPNPNRALINGARNGKLNRGEFVRLNQKRNEIARMRAEGKVGEMSLLVAEAEYSQMQSEYLAKDVFIPAEPKSEAGRFYDGVKSGEISNREGEAYLKAERENQRQKGGPMSAALEQFHHQNHLTDISTNSEKDLSYYFPSNSDRFIPRRGGFGPKPEVNPLPFDPRRWGPGSDPEYFPGWKPQVTPDSGLPEGWKPPTIPTWPGQERDLLRPRIVPKPKWFPQPEAIKSQLFGEG